MNTHAFTFAGTDLVALPSGALFWPAQGVLVVSDLHLGKSARQARFGGAQLPPYETRDTLARLEADLNHTGPRHVICLGDSFDAPGLDRALPEEEALWINRLQAGVEWTWIEGNHDPGPVALGGAHRAELKIADLTFRHIALDRTEPGEVSGHYHPKARLQLRGRSLSRPCFLFDDTRLIVPAYGSYTGGLRCDDPTLCALMSDTARAILTGPQTCEIPMPRDAGLRQKGRRAPFWA